MDTFEAMPYEHRKSGIYKRKKKNMSKTIPHRQKGHLDTPFFVCVCVSQVTLIMKKLPSQTKRSRLASTYFLTLQNNFICTFFLQRQSPSLSPTCRNSSAQRCAVGQSRPAVTKARGINFSGKVLPRKGCVIGRQLSFGFWVLASIICLLPGW